MRSSRLALAVIALGPDRRHLRLQRRRRQPLRVPVRVGLGSPSSSDSAGAGRSRSTGSARSSVDVTGSVQASWDGKGTASNPSGDDLYQADHGQGPDRCLRRQRRDPDERQRHRSTARPTRPPTRSPGSTSPADGTERRRSTPTPPVSTAPVPHLHGHVHLRQGRSTARADRPRSVRATGCLGSARDRRVRPADRRQRRATRTTGRPTWLRGLVGRRRPERRLPAGGRRQRAARTRCPASRTRSRCQRYYLSASGPGPATVHVDVRRDGRQPRDRGGRPAAGRRHADHRARDVRRPRPARRRRADDRGGAGRCRRRTSACRTRWRRRRCGRSRR